MNLREHQTDRFIYRITVTVDNRTPEFRKAREVDIEEVKAWRDAPYIAELYAGKLTFRV